MAAEIETFHFHSWAQFKAQLTSHLPGQDGTSVGLQEYIYRGQKNRNWRLVTSFDRRFPNVGLRARTKIFHRWMSCFYNEIAKEFANNYKPTDSRLIALAQHYGLPTRLLDWTYSPYVAAYFALSPQVLFPSKGGDAAVWAMNIDMFKRAVSTREAKILTLTDVGNVRLRNQDGLFVLHKTEDHSLDELLERKGASAIRAIKKFVLPIREAKIAVEDLFLMGISPRTIYPGYSGVAEHVLTQMQFQR